MLQTLKFRMIPSVSQAQIRANFDGRVSPRIIENVNILFTVPSSYFELCGDLEAWIKSTCSARQQELLTSIELSMLRPLPLDSMLPIVAVS
jgi:hypothetical protein